jgi:hypothetical protein
MDANDLENAINSATSSSETEKSGIQEMPKEEEVGFHKGALNTLVAERGELIKMVGNVEAIMQAHIKRLKELGVDLK